MTAGTTRLPKRLVVPAGRATAARSWGSSSKSTAEALRRGCPCPMERPPEDQLAEEERSEDDAHEEGTVGAHAGAERAEGRPGLVHQVDVLRRRGEKEPQRQGRAV